MRVTGFIFQCSYVLEKKGRPVIVLYGRLSDGRTFLIRESRQIPCFYVRQEDVHVEPLASTKILTSGSKTFDGYPASRVEVIKPSDVPPIRDRLHERGVPTYQADVRFAVNYLISRNIRGGCEITGIPIQNGEHSVDVIFENPEIEPADVEFYPRLLSFDIETDPTDNQLLAISMYGEGLDRVLVVDPKAQDMPNLAIGVADEKSALRAFQDSVQHFDPDVLTGWNVINFDLHILNRVASRTSTRLELGRSPGVVRVRKAQGYFGSRQASVPGRLVLDGMDLVRGAFIRFEKYSLDAVSRKVLGEGKSIIGDTQDRASKILERYLHDLPGFAEYARTDSRLAYQVVEKLNLLSLAVARSKLTGMMIDRVSASIASFDFVYLSALHKKQIIAPSVRSSDSRVSERHAGGHVFEPITGMHKNVWAFDFKSLYPSVMRTFNIDPLSYVERKTDEDVIRAINDAQFRREKGILPLVLDELFDARENAKRQQDEVASQAIKILMNSFYGVLATPACRFYNSKLANAITHTGQHFLYWAKHWFEQRGYTVLYGDTDSVFVLSGISTASEALEVGEEIVARFNEELAGEIKSIWNVESKLVLEFEKIYEQLFLPSVRHGKAGARKRYAGLIAGATDVEFVGMEVVRRDWTELAKEVQRELYVRLFAGQPVEDYLHDCVASLRAGDLDEKLTYRKSIRKPLSEYRKTTPPHVAAARKSPNPSHVIEYVITTNGPEPLNRLVHPPDRKHYEEKQIRAVAQPVLDALGLNYDDAVGNHRQLQLF